MRRLNIVDIQAEFLKTEFGYEYKGKKIPGLCYQGTPTTFQSGTQTNTGTTTSKGTQSSTGTTGGAQQNQYTGAQQGLQGNVIGSLENTLNTGAPPGSTNFIPQQMQAYTDYYNQYVAPQLSAQGGGGNPAIGANLAMGLEQLQGSLGQDVYNTNAGVYSSALGQASGTAFNPTGQTYNQATGANTSTNTTQNSNSAGTWQENNSVALGGINALLGTLPSVGGLFQ